MKNILQKESYMIWYNPKHSLFLVEKKNVYTCVNMEYSLKETFTKEVLNYYPHPLTNNISHISIRSYVENHDNIHRKLFNKGFMSFLSGLPIFVENY